MRLGGRLPAGVFERIVALGEKRNRLTQALGLAGEIAPTDKIAVDQRTDDAVSVDDCREAFDVVRFFLREYLGLDLELPLALSGRSW